MYGGENDVPDLVKVCITHNHQDEGTRGQRRQELQQIILAVHQSVIPI